MKSDWTSKKATTTSRLRKREREKKKDKKKPVCLNTRKFAFVKTSVGYVDGEGGSRPRSGRQNQTNRI